MTDPTTPIAADTAEALATEIGTWPSIMESADLVKVPASLVCRAYNDIQNLRLLVEQQADAIERLRLERRVG